MKKIYYKIMLMFVVVTLSATLFTGCKDEELPAATRLFRPVIADNKLVTGLDADTVPYIRLSWDKYADANQYVVKVIASDGTDSASITTDSIGCEFSNLKFDKEYNVKIHSLNTTTKLESKDYIATIATPDFPTQLVNITTSNIIDTQVRIIWNTLDDSGNATGFDSIKVFNATNDSVVAALAVTTNELTAGQKIIRKLSEKTKYRVEAYQNGKYKGKKLFTTTAAESYSGLVVDLRGLTAEDSYKYFSVGSTSTYTNTIDSIVKANPNQNITFVLQGGVTYRMPTLLIPATTGKIKFATGLSLNGQAAFAVSGNFDAAANVTIGGLDFKNIVFTAAPLETSNGANLTPSVSFGGTYLFNFSGAGANIKNISLAGCKIQYKRGVIREKAAVVVDTFAVNNCIFDSIGSYGVIKIDDVGAVYRNISIYNSTFSNCQYFMSGKASMTNSITSIDVENSTFVYCILNSKTLFDLTAVPSIGTFNLKNCLFGISGGNASTTPTVDPLTGATTGISGWSGTVNIPNASDCFFTNDFVWYIKAGATAPAAQIAGTTINTSTTGTFKSPSTKDFRVISTNFSGKKPGDPRWY